MITIYGIFKNADFTEGRGPMMFKFAMAQEQDAWDYVNSKKGIFGCPVPEGGWINNKGHWEVRPIQVFDTLNDIEDWTNGEAKKKALSKLTKSERILLGLEKA